MRRLAALIVVVIFAACTAPNSVSAQAPGGVDELLKLRLESAEKTAQRAEQKADAALSHAAGTATAMPMEAVETAKTRPDLAVPQHADEHAMTNQAALHNGAPEHVGEQEADITAEATVTHEAVEKKEEVEEKKEMLEKKEEELKAEEEKVAEEKAAIDVAQHDESHAGDEAYNSPPEGTETAQVVPSELQSEDPHHPKAPVDPHVAAVHQRLSEAEAKVEIAEAKADAALARVTAQKQALGDQGKVAAAEEKIADQLADGALDSHDAKAKAEAEVKVELGMDKCPEGSTAEQCQGEQTHEEVVVAHGAAPSAGADQEAAMDKAAEATVTHEAVEKKEEVEEKKEMVEKKEEELKAEEEKVAEEKAAVDVAKQDESHAEAEAEVKVKEAQHVKEITHAKQHAKREKALRGIKEGGACSRGKPEEPAEPGNGNKKSDEEHEKNDGSNAEEEEDSDEDEDEDCGDADESDGEGNDEGEDAIREEVEGKDKDGHAHGANRVDALEKRVEALEAKVHGHASGNATIDEEDLAANVTQSATADAAVGEHEEGKPVEEVKEEEKGEEKEEKEKEEKKGSEEGTHKLTDESKGEIENAMEQSVVEAEQKFEKEHGKNPRKEWDSLEEKEKAEFSDDVTSYMKHTVNAFVGAGKLAYVGGGALITGKNLTDAEKDALKADLKDTAKEAAGSLIKGTVVTAKATSYMGNHLYNSIFEALTEVPNANGAQPDKQDRCSFIMSVGKPTLAQRIKITQCKIAGFERLVSE